MDGSLPGPSVLETSQASGLPFPSKGDLPHAEIKPLSPALAGRFFATEPPEKHLSSYAKHCPTPIFK